MSTERASTARDVEAVFRAESGAVLASLARAIGDVWLAADAVQDARSSRHCARGRSAASPTTRARGSSGPLATGPSTSSGAKAAAGSSKRLHST